MITTHKEYNPLYKDDDHFIFLITGGRASGKCLSPETKVIMADLTLREIKDVKVGEFVMGDDGTPRKVLETSKGFGDLYKVKQKNAEDYVVNENHILTVRKTPSAFNDKGNLTKAGTYRRPNGRYPQYGEISDINVVEFMNKSPRFKNCFRGIKSRSIPYPESDVLIPPYLLGLWLGDGTAIYPNITNPEPEIRDYVEEYCKENGFRFVSKWQGGAYHMSIRKSDGNINRFTEMLRAYELISNKHIPQCYISNSERVRLELLAGLLDTDGHYDPLGDYTITQKSEELAKQIKFVADSLGYRTHIASKVGKINGEVKGVYYRLTISGDIERIPCKVERKKDHGGHYQRRSHLTSSLEIEKIEEKGEWCGIGIDGNHRFLLADGTITHNSFSVSTFIERLTFELFKDERGEKIVHNILYTRYTMVSAGISVIPEFWEKVELDGTEKYFHKTKTDIINKMTGARIMFRGIHTSSGNQTAKLKSIHGITTLVVDEAEEWTSEEEFDKIVLSIRKKGIKNRVIIIMNPADSNHFIYKKYIEKTHKIVYYDGVPVQISTHPNVCHIHVNYQTNALNLSPDFIREVEALKLSDPEKYAHVIMGRWSDVAEGAVFKNWGIVDEFPEYAEKQAISVDWGYTNDSTAILRCGVVGNRLYAEEKCYKTHLTSAELIKELKAAGATGENGLFVYADSADPRLIDEIALAGIIIYPVQKGAGSILAGITKMQSMEMFVTKDSTNLQSELRNYVWEKDKDGNYINQPIDKYNHAIDSWRYYCLGKILGKVMKPRAITKTDLGIM